MIFNSLALKEDLGKLEEKNVREDIANRCDCLPESSPRITGRESEGKPSPQR